MTALSLPRAGERLPVLLGAEIKRAWVLARRAAHLLLGLGVVSASGCILPPDGQPPTEARSYPPQLGRSCPAAVVTYLSRPAEGPGCRFSPRVFLTDPDSDGLETRWVIDNLDPLHARFLIDVSLRLKPDDVSCPGQYCVEAKIPNLDVVEFDDPNIPHSLSLFVTDGEFAITTPTDETDLGQIKTGDASVVEMRWGFTITERTMECPCP